MTTDPAGAREFYTAMFGVGITAPFEGEADYTGFQVDGRVVGGIGVLQEDGPPHWSTYFGVVDADATVATVLASGGRVLEEPEDTPYGRIAMCADPQGARFLILNVSDD